MKLLNYLAIASTAIAFTACNNEDSLTSSSETLENGAQVAFQIKMPTVVSSRTATLDDGKAQEYAVDNATLVLFDKDGNIISSHIFTKNELTGAKTDDDAITETINVEVPEKAKEPRYVLALVNAPVSVTAALSKATDYKEFNQLIQESSAITNGYHFMSNSTFNNTNTKGSKLYKTTDGLQDLQVINPLSVSKNRDVAASLATNIFVERATVKVDVTMKMAKQTQLGGSTTEDSNTGLPVITLKSGDKIDILGWTLTTLNKSMYPVKNISATDAADWDNANKYWMANCWRADASYRSYWGIDGNYNGAQTQVNGFADDFRYPSFQDAAASGKGLKDGNDVRCEYCLENTFDVAHQVQNQTTAVLIAAKYILNGKTKAEDFYKVYNTIYSKDNILTHIAEVLNKAGYVKSDGNTSTALETSDFSLITNDNYIFHNIIKFNKNAKDIRNASNLSKVIVDGNSDSNYNMNLLLNTVFGATHIQYYKDGLCYYTQPIRHFDENEVPLYANNNYTFETFTPTGAAGINTADKLGRYGVLRNNWYSVNITAFITVGRPVPHNPNDPGNPSEPINPDPSYPDPNEPNPNTPDPNKPGQPTPTPDPHDPTYPTPTPDDEESYYLNATINVLPWAKRIQSVDF